MSLILSLSVCLLALIIPHATATARAVILLSPVSIVTDIPAYKQSCTANGTSCLISSLMPRIAYSINPLSSIFFTPFSSYDVKSSFSKSTSLYANTIVRKAWPASCSIATLIVWCILASIGLGLTSASLNRQICELDCNRASLAPLIYNLPLP